MEVKNPRTFRSGDYGSVEIFQKVSGFFHNVESVAVVHNILQLFPGLIRLFQCDMAFCGQQCPFQQLTLCSALDPGNFLQGCNVVAGLIQCSGSTELNIRGKLLFQLI